MKTLVAYTTKHGSTESIAQEIASRLRSHGIPTECVDVEKMDEWPEEGLFQNLVIGSPVYGMEWLDSVIWRLKQEDLYGPKLGTPVWAFSVGYP